MSSYNDIHHLLSSGVIPEDVTLESSFQIEDVLVELHKIEDEISYMKGLKKHRAETIDQRIDYLLSRASSMRHLILRTMVKYEPKKNTLTFPSVGKVTRRKAKDEWDIIDEASMLSFFEAQGVKNQVVKIQEVLNKTAAKDMIDSFDEQKTVVPGVKKVPKPESISISYDKDDTQDNSQDSTQASQKPRLSLCESDL